MACAAGFAIPRRSTLPGGGVRLASANVRAARREPYGQSGISLRTAVHRGGRTPRDGTLRPHGDGRSATGKVRLVSSLSPRVWTVFVETRCRRPASECFQNRTGAWSRILVPASSTSLALPLTSRPRAAAGLMRYAIRASGSTQKFTLSPGAPYHPHPKFLVAIPIRVILRTNQSVTPRKVPLLLRCTSKTVVSTNWN